MRPLGMNENDALRQAIGVLTARIDGLYRTVRELEAYTSKLRIRVVALEFAAENKGTVQLEGRAGDSKSPGEGSIPSAVANPARANKTVGEDGGEHAASVSRSVSAKDASRATTPNNAEEGASAMRHGSGARPDATSSSPASPAPVPEWVRSTDKRFDILERLLAEAGYKPDSTISKCVAELRASAPRASTVSVEEMAERLKARMVPWVACGEVGGLTDGMYRALARVALSALPAPDAPKSASLDEWHMPFASTVKPASVPFDDQEGKGPCGGTRCFLSHAGDGVWVHSSKSYGTCRERNGQASLASIAKPASKAQGEPTLEDVEDAFVAARGRFARRPLLHRNSLTSADKAGLAAVRSLCLASRSDVPDAYLAVQASWQALDTIMVEHGLDKKATPEEAQAWLRERLASCAPSPALAFVQECPIEQYVGSLAEFVPEKDRPAFIESATLKFSGAVSDARFNARRGAPSPALAALVEAGDAMAKHLWHADWCREQSDDMCSCGFNQAVSAYKKARAALPKGGAA